MKNSVHESYSQKRPLTFVYSINNSVLHEVPHYKYLGLWITSNLDWTKHIDYVVRNANCKLFFLRRALKFTTPDVRMTAYKALILPSLDYAAIIWDPFTRTNINKIESVQKKGCDSYITALDVLLFLSF